MKCPYCKGSGKIPLFTSVAKCERCGGTGALLGSIGFMFTDEGCIPLTERGIRGFPSGNFRDLQEQIADDKRYAKARLSDSSSEP